MREALLCSAYTRSKTQGLPMTWQIRCCLLHDHFLGFPPLPPASPPPPPTNPNLPPFLICSLQLRWGLNFFSRLCGPACFGIWKPASKGKRITGSVHGSCYLAFDLSLWGEKAKKMQKTKALIFMSCTCFVLFFFFLREMVAISIEVCAVV